MPYTIRKFKNGYRVCLVSDTSKCFSNKPLTQDNAERQLKAIAINELKSKRQKIKGSGVGATRGRPSNKKLYDEISDKVKKEQPKHSLFRSARIQKEYKDAGGTYIGDKPGDKEGLKGWFNAKWISLNDYAHDGDVVPCGSTNTEERYGEYPLCRPLEVAKKIGKTKALKMIKAKDKLKEQPLFTEKVLGTEKYNIKPGMAGGVKLISESQKHEMVGGLKPLTARLGGKVLLKKNLVKHFFPPSTSYNTYVEPFVGGGSVYFYKDKDGHKEVINDIDPLITTIFKGFQKYDGDKIADAVNGDYDKEDFLNIVRSNPTDEFGKFIKMFLINRLSFFARSKTFGKPRINSTFADYKERLTDVDIYGQDWKTIVSKYNKPDTFFYLDPPAVQSDSAFKYPAINIEELKKVCDSIKGKFCLSYPDKDDIQKVFKEYNCKRINTKYVGNRTTGGQTVIMSEWVITNYLPNLTGTGTPKTKKRTTDFYKQLSESEGIDPSSYLRVAKHVAKSRGYDPDLLGFAEDGEHKLYYDSPNGIRKFGRVGYGDFIIYTMGEGRLYPKGYAQKKRNVFRKSHNAITKQYALEKYSPNELAINILW